MSVAIIDYGMGNVASVQKALNSLKIDNLVTKLESEISNAKFILLPGVGSFQQGMQNLIQYNLDSIIKKEVIQNKKAFLGICLGMQLIATSGTEPNECKGLNLIEGVVTKLELKDKKIPHLGWNNIESKNIFLNPFDAKDFYFIHSYHFNVKHKEDIAATVNYGEEIIAAIQKDNVFATQFHPEKSQKNGLKLLQSFFELNA